VCFAGANSSSAYLIGVLSCSMLVQLPGCEAAIGHQERPSACRNSRAMLSHKRSCCAHSFSTMQTRCVNWNFSEHQTLSYTRTQPRSPCRGTSGCTSSTSTGCLASRVAELITFNMQYITPPEALTALQKHSRHKQDNVAGYTCSKTTLTPRNDP
jgi:hypothetical protein